MTEQFLYTIFPVDDTSDQCTGRERGGKKASHILAVSGKQRIDNAKGDKNQDYSQNELSEIFSAQTENAQGKQGKKKYGPASGKKDSQKQS